MFVVGLRIVEVDLAHRFVKQRRQRATFGLALSLALLACGGDVGSNPDAPDEDASTQPGLDAGSTSTLMDAAVDGALRDARAEGDAQSDDASQALGLDGGDAGAALAAALSADGVNASIERATLVSQASCERAAVCEAPAAPDPDCSANRIASYQAQVDMSWPAGCLDAMLDFFGCSTSLPTCDAFVLGCPDKLAIYMTACADQLASP